MNKGKIVNITVIILAVATTFLLIRRLYPMASVFLSTTLVIIDNLV